MELVADWCDRHGFDRKRVSKGDVVRAAEVIAAMFEWHPVAGLAYEIEACFLDSLSDEERGRRWPVTVEQVWAHWDAYGYRRPPHALLSAALERRNHEDRAWVGVER